VKLPNNIHDPEREDLIRQIEVLFDVYRYDDYIRNSYWARMDDEGQEAILEQVKRDLPDGFSRGRFMMKDIHRQLSKKGC